MAVFTGSMALGTGIAPGGVFQEVSGGSYAREALALTGSGQAGLSQALTSIAAAAAPAGAEMRLGAFMDAAGNLLAYFELPAPLVAVGAAFPATTINVQFENTIATAFSQGASEIYAAGTQIGTVNGAPLIAGTNLALSNGNLIAEPGNQVVNNPLFMVNGVNVGRFDASGNLIIKGTITASGNP